MKQQQQQHQQQLHSAKQESSPRMPETAAYQQFGMPMNGIQKCIVPVTCSAHTHMHAQTQNRPNNQNTGKKYRNF